MAVEPYLFFNGRCEEAIEFYQKALGAEVSMLMRYKESPEPAPPGMVPPGWDNKIMHSRLRVGNANIMASDGCSEGLNFQGFSLSLGTSVPIPWKVIACRVSLILMRSSGTGLAPCAALAVERAL